MDIFISIIISLISSLIWVFFTILFDFYAKNKIDVLLQLAEDSSRLLVHSINYSDYHTALNQADNLISNILDISNTMKFFTFRFQRGKRKLFFTILYNAIYNLSIFKNITIGYEGKMEFDARCSKYNNQYLYKIHTENLNEIFLTFSFDLLQYINKYNSLKKGINKCLLHLSNSERRQVLEQLIECKSFNSKGSFQHFMRKSTFTREQYLRLIKRFYKR